MLKIFWSWYKKNLILNQTIVAVLFGWQLLHLYWLTTHVVAGRIWGEPLFDPGELYQFLLIIADYFEVPALISGTLLYFNFSGEKLSRKNIVFLLLINSQWLHLFWITDEFVLAHFRGEHQYLPDWLAQYINFDLPFGLKLPDFRAVCQSCITGLAWLAIFIDYLELPVIYDTIKNTLIRFFKKNIELKN